MPISQVLCCCYFFGWPPFLSPFFVWLNAVFPALWLGFYSPFHTYMAYQIQNTTASEKINGDDYHSLNIFRLKNGSKAWKALCCHCSILTNLMVNTTSSEDKGVLQQEKQVVGVPVQKVGQPISTLPATGFMSNCLLRSRSLSYPTGRTEVLFLWCLMLSLTIFIPYPFQT